MEPVSMYVQHLPNDMDLFDHPWPMAEQKGEFILVAEEPAEPTTFALAD